MVAESVTVANQARLVFLKAFIGMPPSIYNIDTCYLNKVTQDVEKNRQFSKYSFVITIIRRQTHNRLRYNPVF